MSIIAAKTWLKCYDFLLPILFISSQLFFLCCMINILMQMKKLLTDLMNRLPQFITQSIDWYDGLDQSIFFFLVFFLEKTELDLFAFCLLQRD